MAGKNVAPQTLQTAFAERKITPNIIKVAPKKLLTVNFQLVSLDY